jgi:hypothetical protein
MHTHQPMMDPSTVTHKPPPQCRASVDRPSHFLAYNTPYATGLCSPKAKRLPNGCAKEPQQIPEDSFLVELSCGTAYIIHSLDSMNRSHVPHPTHNQKRQPEAPVGRSPIAHGLQLSLSYSPVFAPTCFLIQHRCHSPIRARLSRATQSFISSRIPHETPCPPYQSPGRRYSKLAYDKFSKSTIHSTWCTNWFVT